MQRVETGNEPELMRGSGTEWLAFRPSSIHGWGGFANQKIPSGTRIIEYLGKRITKQESLRLCEQSNEYIFTLNELEDLDGNVPWNPARLLNHSCTPNSEAELASGQIWIVAVRDIPAGEEITFNYGYDLEGYQGYPCNCGSSDCVGFMVAEEFFGYVRGRGAPWLGRAGPG